MIWHDGKKPRPRALTGKTYNIETPAGKAFITINENGGTQPFEAFINTAKAGSETAAVSEAIGRTHLIYPAHGFAYRADRTHA